MRKLLRCVARSLRCSPRCSLAPKYERPPRRSPTQLPARRAAGRRVAAADLGWRDVFGDPRLQALIALALREQPRPARSPRSTSSGRARSTGSSARRCFPQRRRVSAAPTSRGGAATTAGARRYQRRRRRDRRASSICSAACAASSDAALEEYLATDEAQRAAHLALVGEVATQYLRERALDEQRALAEQTLAARRASRTT